MLISPPFLPARGAAQTEDTWLEACMTGGAPGEGAFPVSFNLGWHGGVHLTAPAANPATANNPFEKVRAIADGTVVFVRQAIAQPAGPLPPDHAQAYKGGWTDNGCVVIRHDTEIGEGVNASVRFFSIYMHLRSIDSGIVLNRVVYRKAALGAAGQIYAHPGDDAAKIHFEIICDGANLAKLVGRASGDLPLTDNGRTDAVFGEMYFHLPVGTQFFVHPAHPAHHLTTATTVATTGHPALPIADPFTSTTAQIVGLRYAGGQGAAGNRGDATLRSYQLGTNFGVDLGVEIGAAIPENDAEYNLYTSANEISKSYPAAARPAPSAVYELLRFGRVIGPDVLTPATAPHWRKVNYPGGQGWVNLNTASIHRFSDADYPHWKGWKLINDDPTPDSHCNSPIVRGWLDPQGAGISLATATTRLGNADVQKKLKKAIFKFPTEWDSTGSAIDARWGWLKKQSLENPTPMSAADFEKLRAHITALAFWPGGSAIDANHWHFEPRQFIRHFRQCGWLSANEFAQAFPRRQLHLQGAAFHEATTAWATVLPIATRWAIQFNLANRRYGLSSNKQRLTHYFSHVIPETGYLRLMKEGDNQAGTYLSGQPYWPYYGRGLIQLTWLAGYEKYGVFRNFPKTLRAGRYVDLGWSPDDFIALSNTTFNATNCADSACFYVASHESMVRLMDRSIEQIEAIAVSKCVNGNVAIQNLNGLDARLQSILFLRDFLLDNTPDALTETLTFNWRRNSSKEAITDGNGKVKKVFILRDNPWSIAAPLDKQRP